MLDGFPYLVVFSHSIDFVLPPLPEGWERLGGLASILKPIHERNSFPISPLISGYHSTQVFKGRLGPTHQCSRPLSLSPQLPSALRRVVPGSGQKIALEEKLSVSFFGVIGSICQHSPSVKKRTKSTPCIFLSPNPG